MTGFVVLFHCAEYLLINSLKNTLNAILLYCLHFFKEPVSSWWGLSFTLSVYCLMSLQSMHAHLVIVRASDLMLTYFKQPNKLIQVVLKNTKYSQLLLILFLKYFVKQISQVLTWEKKVHRLSAYCCLCYCRIDHTLFSLI